MRINYISIHRSYIFTEFVFTYGALKTLIYSETVFLKLSPYKKQDRYEPLRSISAKLSPVIGITGSKSFGEHLSTGMGHLINKPMAVFSKKMSSSSKMVICSYVVRKY